MGPNRLHHQQVMGRQSKPASKRHSQVLQSGDASSASIDCDVALSNRSQIQIKYSLQPFKSWERQRESQKKSAAKHANARAEMAKVAPHEASPQPSGKQSVRGSVVRAQHPKHGSAKRGTAAEGASEGQSQQRAVPFPFLQRKQERRQTYQQNGLSDDLQSPSAGPASGPTLTKGPSSIAPYQTQTILQPSPVAPGSAIAAPAAVAPKQPSVPNLFTIFNSKTKEIFQVRVNPVMTIGGLKSKISGKYNLEDENDVII